MDSCIEQMLREQDKNGSEKANLHVGQNRQARSL